VTTNVGIAALKSIMTQLLVPIVPKKYAKFEWLNLAL